MRINTPIEEMEIYFNTTNKSGKDLQDSEKKAVGQNEKIMEFYRSLKIGSPSNVWSYVFDGKIPITSCRRAITTLTKQGLLIKTDLKAPGLYGEPEHIWKLKPQPGIQTKLF